MTSIHNILVVEDDIVDIMTIQRAIKQLQLPNHVDYCNNGLEALEYLNSEKKLPGLILLDLNMPKMNGIEFLDSIRKNNEFARIPVVVLTTSKEQSDKLSTFNLSVSGYMVKPISYEAFKDMVKTIHHYWELSELPY